MFKVCDKKCKKCLFTKDRIVSKERMAQILEECEQKNTHFICHEASMKDEDVCCSGFYETQSSNLMRIAQRLNMVKFVNMDEDATSAAPNQQ